MSFQPYAISQSQLLSTFMPEQILRGKVLEILPDRNALLQLGNRQVVAKVGAIEPPLKTGQDYLFQIQQNTNPLVAKVVAREASAESGGSSTVEEALRTLGLGNESALRSWAQTFLDKGLPLTRQTLSQVHALFGNRTPTKEDSDAVRWMIQRQLPLTRSFLHIARMLSSSDQPLTDQLHLLSQLIEQGKQTTTVQALQKNLERLTESINDTRFTQPVNEISEKNADLRSGQQFIPIPDIMKQLGFDFENQLRQQLLDNQPLAASGTVKEALLAVAQDKDAPHTIRQMAQALAGQITGQQLQMLSSDSVAAQFTLQLPLPLQHQLTNVTVYWESKKNKQGKIDPDYCTLLLCLNLEHLKETQISVRVQNRAVSLRVQNDLADLRNYLKAGETVLDQQLNKLNYHLTSIIQVEKLDDQLVRRAMQPLTPLTHRLDVLA
ncbi:MAG: hypothetical protein ABF820_07700 [Sporolactobacillus sp.]